MSEHYCLKWNNYRPNLTSAFKLLREEEHFVDVTLSVEGINLKAHKVVLSACSNYFRDLLRGISVWQHPVLFLRDIPLLDLSLVLEFVYVGEVSVSQANLQSFLKTAGLLRIKGLADDEDDAEYMNKKRRVSRSDPANKSDEKKMDDDGKPNLGSHKRGLELDPQLPAKMTKTLGLKKSSILPKLSKIDTSKVKVDEAELKQEPAETEPTADPLTITAADPSRASGQAASDGTASFVKSADPPTTYMHTSDNSDVTSHSATATSNDLEKSEQNGVGKADIEGRVICHVCRAVLSNTNALCYHMNYVHSTSVQNIDMIRSLSTGDVSVKEEIQ